jgi:hypothetical protein
MQHSSSPSQAALLARWRSWVAAKVQTPGGYHFNDLIKMVPTGEQPQAGQAAGGHAGGQVIRFPVERCR